MSQYLHEIWWRMSESSFRKNIVKKSPPSSVENEGSNV